MQQKKYEGALTMLRVVYSKQKESIGENHPHTLVTEGNIVKSLLGSNRKDEALNMLIDLYEKKIVSLGQNNKVVVGLKERIDAICGS